MKLFSYLWPDSFRLRLSLLIGGLFLITTLIDYASLKPQLDQNLLQDKGEVIQAIAQGIAKSLSVELKQRRRELTLQAHAPAFIDTPLESPSLVSGIEQFRQASPDYVWMGVVTPDGRVFAASGESPSHRIEFVAPLHDTARKLRGTLVAESTWDWVSTLIDERLPRNTAGEALQVFIAGQNNQVLFPQATPSQTNMPPPLDGASYLQGYWPDGNAYLYADANIDAAPGWRVIVRQPPQQALAAVNRLLSTLVLPEGIATLLLIVVVYQLARAFSRPLETLVNTAQRISAGEEKVEWSTETGARELRQLSLAIRQMASTLLARRGELAAINASLEKKVEERTEALSEANRQLAERATLLEQMARSDSLTGLGNRMAATERLTAEYQRFHRSHAPYSVLLMDADHFKRVNDTYGHAVGDQVLQQIAETLSCAARTTDFVARYGGEEFLLLLPDTDAEGALKLAERIRLAISASSKTAAGIITVSIGAACACEEDDTHETIVQRADEALYRAKANGRNRVEGG